MMGKLAFPYRQIQLALMLVLLSSCAGGDKNADIKEFMAEVERKPKGNIAPLPEFEPYQAFTYGASNRRSPFEPPIVVPAKTMEQKQNIGVKPPENHAAQYLERFNLKSLKMVGSLTQENLTFALVLDASGGVHRVQIGDYMGQNWGRIDSITDNGVDITEIVSDGQGGWLRRPRTLELDAPK